MTPQDGSALCGFQCGNKYQPGCLTLNQAVRLHSCERGLECEHIKSSPAVFVTPIITRATNGEVLPELGAGGGRGDLEQSHEIDLQDPTAAIELMKLCSDKVADADAKVKTLRLITQAMASGSIFVPSEDLDFGNDLSNMPLGEFTLLLQKIAATKNGGQSPPKNATTALKHEETREPKSREQLSKHIVRHLHRSHLPIIEVPVELSLLASFIVRRALSSDPYIQTNGHISMHR